MLELPDVSKRYGDVAAPSDCSFQVHPGRLTGFVGPNGAGKTNGPHRNSRGWRRVKPPAARGAG